MIIKLSFLLRFESFNIDSMYERKCRKLRNRVVKFKSVFTQKVKIVQTFKNTQYICEGLLRKRNIIYLRSWKKCLDC